MKVFIIFALLAIVVVNCQQDFDLKKIIAASKGRLEHFNLKQAAQDISEAALVINQIADQFAHPAEEENYSVDPIQYKKCQEACANLPRKADIPEDFYVPITPRMLCRADCEKNFNNRQ